MNVSIFYEKLNKVDGNVYVVEEAVRPTDGVYEGELPVSYTHLDVYKRQHFLLISLAARLRNFLPEPPKTVRPPGKGLKPSA